MLQGKKQAQAVTASEIAANAKQIETDLKQEKTQFDKAAKLRGEVVKAQGDFPATENAFERIKASPTGDDATGQSDMSLIFSFMKMLDPASVVREGEFATAERTEGIAGAVVNAYNKALSGERLIPKQRQNFINQAGRIFKQADKLNEKRMASIISIAKRAGIDKADLFGEQEPAAGAPPLADVKDVGGLSDEQINQMLGGQ